MRIYAIAILLILMCQLSVAQESMRTDMVDRYHNALQPGSEATILNWPAHDYPRSTLPKHVVDALEETEPGASRQNSEVHFGCCSHYPANVLALGEALVAYHAVYHFSG